MNSYFVAFLLSLGTALALTPVARRLGLRWGVVDRGGGRKIHSGAIPRLGGPAVAAATLLPLGLILFWNNKLAGAIWERGPQMLGLGVGGVLALVLGLLDDVRYIRARWKLLLQVGIAVVAFLVGVRIQSISLPFVGTLDMGALALPVTVFWIVGVMNAVNLIDGMDGLCAGVVFIASATVFAVAALGSNTVVAFVAAALAGAALGFLRYNFNPAKIFLGDSGAYFMGYVLGAASIIGANKATTTVAFLAPLLAFGLPFLDTSLAIFRRMVGGAPLFAPDRGHIHHRLLDTGQSQRRVALTLYGLSIVFAASGLVIVFAQSWAAGLALSLVTVLVVYLGQLLGRRPAAKSQRRPFFGGPIKAEEMVYTLPALAEALPGVPGFSDLRAEVARFAAATGIDEMSWSLHPAEIPAGEREWEWHGRPTRADGRRSPMLSARVELRTRDRDVGTWTLAWRSENGRVERETDALLKLAGTMIASRIEALSSSDLARRNAAGGAKA